MAFTNLEIGLILMEGSILLSFLVLLLFLKRRMNPAWAKRVKGTGKGGRSSAIDLLRLQELIRETELLSQGLSKNLEEKNEITRHLVETLDKKMMYLESLIRQVKEKEKKTLPGVREEENQEPILQMALSGCGVADIAKRLGRSKEEIQLILDVGKLTPDFNKG